MYVCVGGDGGWWFLRHGFLCICGCPGTPVDKLTLNTASDPPASASGVLGLKAYTATAQKSIIKPKFAG